MNHSDWVNEVSNGDAINAIATKAGIIHRTFARQVERGHISAENVLAIAVAYEIHPVGALVDTGYLDEEWARQVDPMHALRSVTEDQLAQEVLRRMKLGVERGGALDIPIDELEERRRSNKQNTHVRGMAYDLDTKPEGAVADGSPDEDALREESDGDWTDPNNIP